MSIAHDAQGFPGLTFCAHVHSDEELLQLRTEFSFQLPQASHSLHAKEGHFLARIDGLVVKWPPPPVHHWFDPRSRCPLNQGDTGDGQQEIMMRYCAGTVPVIHRVVQLFSHVIEDGSHELGKHFRGDHR